MSSDLRMATPIACGVIETSVPVVSYFCPQCVTVTGIPPVKLCRQGALVKAIGTSSTRLKFTGDTHGATAASTLEVQEHDAADTPPQPRPEHRSHHEAHRLQHCGRRRWRERYGGRLSRHDVDPSSMGKARHVVSASRAGSIRSATSGCQRVIRGSRSRCGTQRAGTRNESVTSIGKRVPHPGY